MGTEKKAILDISGDLLTLVVQDEKYEGNAPFRKTLNFSGYKKGEFYEVNELFAKVSTMVQECQNSTFCPISEVWVGVPGEFCTVVTKNYEKSLGLVRKITSADVERFLEDSDSFKDNDEYYTINSSPVYFYIDGGKKTLNPVGVTTSTMGAFLSYVLCKKSFYEIFQKIGENIGVKFELTSSVLAEVMYIVPQEERDDGVIFVDSGYMSTSVAYAKGDGMMSLGSFSVGSGHIAGDLMTCMNNMKRIPYLHAKELLSKVNFNIKPSSTDVYTITVNGEDINYFIREVNEISIARVRDIAAHILTAIERSNVRIRPNAPILLTGAGIPNMIGAKEIVEEVTGRVVRIIMPDYADLAKPQYSSLAALMRVQQVKNYKPQNKIITLAKTIIGKIFRRNK